MVCRIKNPNALNPVLGYKEPERCRSTEEIDCTSEAI